MRFLPTYYRPIVQPPLDKPMRKFMVGHFSHVDGKHCFLTLAVPILHALKLEELCIFPMWVAVLGPETHLPKARQVDNGRNHEIFPFFEVDCQWLYHIREIRAAVMKPQPQRFWILIKPFDNIITPVPHGRGGA